MRDGRSEDVFREELASRRGRIIAVAAISVVGVAAIGGAYAALRGRGPSEERRRALASALTPNRPSATGSGQAPRTKGEQGGPLGAPDGGWPEAPRNIEGMDEVPTGTLTRGSRRDRGDVDEGPATKLTVPAFFIDRYEATNEEYQRCVAAEVCRPQAELDPARFGAPRQPAAGLSWFDAAAYCRWSGKRLPSEAEWERAARGDDRRLYPWGDDPPTCERAVFVNCDRYGPAEVGGRAAGAGPFGTHDLSGNVWEWVDDWYAPQYYPPGSDRTPQAPPAGTGRVLRGGSWQFGARHIRAANRHRDDPDHRTPWYGVRCAYRPPPPAPSLATSSSSSDGGNVPDGVGGDAGPPPD